MSVVYSKALMLILFSSDWLKIENVFRLNHPPVYHNDMKYCVIFHQQTESDDPSPPPPEEDLAAGKSRHYLPASLII